MAASNPIETSSGGSGSSLDPAILLSAGLATLVATCVTTMSIYMHLKNYRKPVLQRMVIRIMIMVPLYAISSLIALFSLEAAFVIDAVRDIYEAFVIYCFFHLLVAYLGGERSLLILLYGRPPKHHLFPVKFFKREFDGSDPFTFLLLRRGIFQYVYLKPVLAAVTLILKAAGVYNEGSLKASSGYLWISIVYNTSICCSLYCLAMFWICIDADVKPFRPMPKFLCVKGILFFSFWQAIGVSILVSVGAIKHIGPYKDAEHISLAITDSLVCFEMPFFALAHTFAFSYTDFIDSKTHYAARMPMYYAFRDAFGLVDVFEDSRATLKGGVSYRKYEPVEGGMHQGYGRERRIRAGLRYVNGGQQKYWLPMPEDNMEPTTGPMSAVRNFLEERRVQDKGYAPLLEDQEDVVVHEEAPPSPERSPAADAPLASAGNMHAFSAPYVEEPDKELEDLEFHAPDEEEDELYEEGKKLLFGDYNYPVIDVSSEAARRSMWDEEERILTDRRAAAFSPIRTSDGIATTPAALLAAQKNRTAGYGAAGHTSGPGRGDNPKGKGRFYALAGENLDPTSTTNPDRTVVRFDEHGAIIDMSPEAQRDAGGDGEGVRLSLTNKAHVLPANMARKGSGRKASKPADPADGGYLTPTNHRPSTASRSPSNASFHSSSPTDNQPRPDAVDLVVEDPKAAQADMLRERRKGEPAVRQTGQRKVYKAAYTIEDEDDEEGDKEVTVEREIEEGVEDPNRGGAPEIDRTKIRVQDSHGHAEEEEQDAGGGAMAEVKIIRAATPPPHATIEWNTHRSPPISPYTPVDDNPWA